MAEIRRIPQVIVHEIVAGNIMTGVAPNGTDSEETLFRGGYRRWLLCTLAGLFQLPVAFRNGWRLERLVWNLPGGGNITVNLVDESGVAYQLNQVAAASGEYVSREAGGILVIPGWSIQVTSVNAVGPANGRVIVYTNKGWSQHTFDEAPILGEEHCVPPKL